MPPDVVQIGSHTYALTLNLILTGSRGAAFSIALFLWQRKVRKDDKLREELLLVQEKANTERHEAVLESVTTLKEALGEKSDTLFRKIDDFCRESAADRAKMKRNFWKHYHDDEDPKKIYVTDYEP